MTRSAILWAIAAAASLGAAAVLMVRDPAGKESESEAARSTECDAADVGRLRRDLVAAESEGRFLRAELDRMRGMLEQKRESDQIRKEWDGGVELTDAERTERLAAALERLPELSARLMTGEEEVYRGMRDVVRAMLSAPMDDPSLFRKTYEENTDTSVRRLVLPHIVARDPDDARAFVLEELSLTEDPDLRADLLRNLRFATNVAEDPEARGVLTAALESEDSPRARLAAVDILGGAQAPEVEEALLRVAADDADPSIRESAIRLLASNPDTRARILELTSGERDPRLRTVGECTARLSELDGSG